MEEVQLSEEELQKARDDFKVGMAPGRLQLYHACMLCRSASLHVNLHSCGGIGHQRTSVWGSSAGQGQAHQPLLMQQHQYTCACSQEGASMCETFGPPCAGLDGRDRAVQSLCYISCSSISATGVSSFFFHAPLCPPGSHEAQPFVQVFCSSIAAPEP